MRCSILTLVLTLTLMPCSFAQRTINYRLVLFGKGEITNSSYTNSSKGKEIVRVTPGYVADPIAAKLRQNKFLDFYKTGEGGGGLKPDFTVEVSARAGKDLLIVLYQDGAELKPKVLDFKAMKLKGGDRVMINFLSVPVAVRFSDPEGKKWDAPILVEADRLGLIPSPGAQTVFWKVSSPAVPAGKKPAKPVKAVWTEDWVVFKKGIVMTRKKDNDFLCTYMSDGDKRPTFEMVTIHTVK